jgi:hypothetical protein
MKYSAHTYDMSAYRTDSSWKEDELENPRDVSFFFGLEYKGATYGLGKILHKPRRDVTEDNTYKPRYSTTTGGSKTSRP